MAIDPITAGIGLVNTVVSRVWPDASEADRQKAAMALAELQAQTDINKAEASNPSVFVSGWRPFVGWVCGIALCYASLIEPLLRFLAVVIFGYGGAFPEIDTQLTFQVLIGLLGLGVMRTVEKKDGVARRK